MVRRPPLSWRLVASSASWLLMARLQSSVGSAMNLSPCQTKAVCPSLSLCSQRLRGASHPLSIVGLSVSTVARLLESALPMRTVLLNSIWEHPLGNELTS